MVRKQLENLSCWFLVNISFALLRSSYFNFLRSLQILLFLRNFFQMSSLNRHERVTFFMQISVAGKNELENLAYKFFVNISFALLRSSYFNFLRSLQILLFLTNFIQMLSLNRHDRVTFFKEISVAGKNELENLSYKFIVIISFALLRSSYCYFLTSFKINLFLTNFTQLLFYIDTRKLLVSRNFPQMVKNNWKIFHTKFSSLFHLHCHFQFTSILYLPFVSFCF